MLLLLLLTLLTLLPNGDVFFLRRLPCSSVSSTLAMSRIDAFDGIIEGDDENIINDGDKIESDVIADDAIIVDGDAVSCVNDSDPAA